MYFYAMSLNEKTSDTINIHPQRSNNTVSGRQHCFVKKGALAQGKGNMFLFFLLLRQHSLRKASRGCSTYTTPHETADLESLPRRVVL